MKNRGLFVDQQYILKSPTLVIVTHGIAETSSNYHRLASVLNDNGYSVVLYDLRGHGASEGTRGHIKSYTVFIEDLHYLVELYQKSYQNVVLLGHSLGAGITNAYACTYNDIKGIICIGNPMVTPKAVLPLRKVPGILAYFKRIKTNFNDSNLQSTKYTSNPLDLKSFNLQLVKQTMIYQVRYFQKNASNIKCQVLWCYGEDDTIASPNMKQDYELTFPLICSTKKLIAFKGLKHNIFLENNINNVYFEIITFLGSINYLD